MNGLGIDELTIGVSANGARDYLHQINTVAIENAVKTLRNTANVKSALRSGWQGQAELNFEGNIDKSVEVVAEQLNVIKAGIESLVSDMIEEWAKQDAKLVEEANDIVSFN